MSKFNITEKNKVKRVPKRAHYDQQTVYQILDAAFVGHVGFSMDQQPFVIPMAFGRNDNTIFLHGATKSRLIQFVQTGIPVCMTVTHLDGMVLARSAFHHSMNYRSAVVFGKAFEVAPENKEEALYIISENILKGRWEAARKPNPKELKATSVLAFVIEDGSAKIRTGPPVDEKEDYDLPIWAGVIPFQSQILPAIPDPLLMPGLPQGDEIDQLYLSI